MLKKIEASSSRCYYEVELQQSNEISIRIENFDLQMLYRLNIDNLMLQEHHLDIQAFHLMMAKQFLHESRKIARMIQYQNGNITISFDFPKSPMKQYQFKCQAINLDKTALSIQMITRFAQQKMKYFQSLIKDAQIRFEQFLRHRIQQSIIKIDKKFHQLNSIFEKSFNQKIGAFEKFIQSKEEVHEKKYEKYLSQSILKIMQSNEKLSFEVNVIKKRLEAKISTLDANLTTEQERIEDLQSLMEENKQLLENQIVNLNQKWETIEKQLIDKLHSILTSLYRQHQIKITIPGFKIRPERHEKVIERDKQKTQIFENGIDESIFETADLSNQLIQKFYVDLFQEQGQSPAVISNANQVHKAAK